jgi:cytokinin dehydrogenase
MKRSVSRRQLLGGMAAGSLIAFDLQRRAWVSAAHAQSSAVTIPDLDGELTLEPAALGEAADDFGHIVHRTPVAVLRPGSEQDVVRAVQFAKQHGLTVAMRGQAHSTYGQAQAQGGIVIDSRTLATIHAISPEGAVVGPGVRWIDLLTQTLQQGLTPPVLTDYIELSVGGTLSVGGIGGATHRHGFQVDNVLELEVVTGEGKRLICSATQRPLLFRSVLAGLGQYAIIVRAKLRLIPAHSSARVFRLFYTDLAMFMADQRIAMADQRFDYLEGSVTLLPEGGASFMLEAASYYTPPSTPDNAALLAGLTPLSGSTLVEEHTYFDWCNRLAPLVALLQTSGAWSLPHPWFDVFLPDESALAYVSATLPALTPETTGNGPILLYPFPRNKATRPLLALPDSDTIFTLNVLRFAPPDPAVVQALVQENRSLFEQARNVGGKKYPIGSIPFTRADWLSHYGLGSLLVLAAKQSFDPEHVLTPGQGIFERR